MSATASSTGTYVFGVTAPDAALPVDLDARPLASAVRGVVVGRLQAVVGDVDVDGFVADDLEDPAWLVPRARAHDAVLRAVVEECPVVPFRFGVVHRDHVALGEALDASSQTLDRALTRVRTAQEWTLELVVTRRTAMAGSVAPASRGRSYLAARQAELHAREQLVDAVAPALAWCREHAIPAVPLAAAADGAGRLACLVRRGCIDDVLASLTSDAVLPDGVTVRASGPLPPYRFVDDDVS